MTRKESIRERELHIPNPEHNLTSSEMLEEREEIEPCSVEQEPSNTGETLAEHFRTLLDPTCFTKEIIPMKGRNWKSIRANESYKYRSLSAVISRMVRRLLCHYYQDEREIHGAVRWNTMSPKITESIRTLRSTKLLTKKISSNTFMKEVSR